LALLVWLAALPSRLLLMLPPSVAQALLLRLQQALPLLLRLQVPLLPHLWLQQLLFDNFRPLKAFA
jgi:hypothetical protein